MVVPFEDGTAVQIQNAHGKTTCRIVLVIPMNTCTVALTHQSTVPMY